MKRFEMLKAAPPLERGVPKGYKQHEQMQIEDAEQVEVSGLAAPWDTPIDRAFYKVEFRRGCFASAVNDPESVVILYQHDSDEPIGRAMRFENDNAGLILTARLTQETQRGKESVALLRSEIINGLSVGFSYDRYEVREGDTFDTIVVLEATLFEVSLVTMPAAKVAGVTGGKLSGEISDTERLELRQELKAITAPVTA